MNHSLSDESGEESKKLVLRFQQEVRHQSLPHRECVSLTHSTSYTRGVWLRGPSKDDDEWASLVGNNRWSYEGQLPYMKKPEAWYDEFNPKQHGQDGPIAVASTALSGFEHNSGDNMGRAQLCEAREDGPRQHAARCYSLDRVETLVDTLVGQIVIEQVDGKPKAAGVELEDGSVIRPAEVIVSAGSFNSPQLLMLSGIGPASHLAEHGIETVVDLPEVGQNLHDNVSMY